jgi:hypothetical protein
MSDVHSEGAPSSGSSDDSIAWIGFSWISSEDASGGTSAEGTLRIPDLGDLVSIRTEKLSAQEIVGMDDIAAGYSAANLASIREGKIPLPESFGAFLERIPVNNPEAMEDWQVLIIDRKLSNSPSLVTHLYSVGKETVSAVEVLMESLVGPTDPNRSKLFEDFQLLKFALVAGKGSNRKGEVNESHTSDRATVHRKLRPLVNENFLFRKALGLSPTEKVTPVTLAQRVHEVRRGSITSDRTNSQDPHHNTSKEESVAPGGHKAKGPHAHKVQLQPRTSKLPGELADDPSGGESGGEQLKYDMKPDSAHSPLAWELETEAAINSRSRYDPYRQRISNHRQLDKVTLQQLVSRLHDKSCDQRSKRLHDNEERVLRELGRLERRVLSQDEQLDLATRLHDKWQEHVKQSREELREQYLRPLSPSKKLEIDQQKAMASRLHDECMVKTKEEMKKLHEEYVESKELPKLKLSVEQQQAMADRLSKYHERTFA